MHNIQYAGSILYTHYEHNKQTRLKSTTCIATFSGQKQTNKQKQQKDKQNTNIRTHKKKQRNNNNSEPSTE